LLCNFVIIVNDSMFTLSGQLVSPVAEGGDTRFIELFSDCQNYVRITCEISFFYIHPVLLDITKVFYSPTDAQVNCLRDNFKFTLKFTLKQLRHVSVQSPSSGSALFVLAKVTVVKIAN
jgi:hypothetical protein